MTKTKGAKPAVLIRRDVKHKCAASLLKHYLNGAVNCQDERGAKRDCKCIRRNGHAFLSAIERYVDSTWKEPSFIERLAIAKRQSPVESCGMTGKFYLPIEKGFKFHPVCANTFCRLLGCSKREFPQMKRALTDRDWLCPDLGRSLGVRHLGSADGAEE